MVMKITKERLDWIRSMAAVLVIVFVSVGFAGDFRWLKISDFEVASSEFAKALSQLEINQLDRQITFLQTKVRVGEATSSERIILPELERQLRELQSENQ